MANRPTGSSLTVHRFIRLPVGDNRRERSQPIHTQRSNDDDPWARYRSYVVARAYRSAIVAASLAIIFGFDIVLLIKG